MRAGKLRHKVTIRRPVASRNDFAEEETVWESAASFRADVRDLKGREYFAAKQVSSDISVEVRCRYRTDIRPEYRLLTASGRILEIVSPPANPDGKRRELIVMCKEIFQ